MSETAIRIEGFSKRFGDRYAVDDLSFEVATGSVCGLLGPNGAGKTTTIRCMLDLLRPTTGRIEVLGLDSVRDSVAVRERVGYLPEEPDYISWMKVSELLWFNAGFFPGWDEQLAAELIERLGLPVDRRMRDLSRGMQAKVGLTMALAQRPDVLVLDDPTSGLDPVVRRDFLEAVIANVQSEGGTVFFSTHLIHEMERVADEVAIVQDGRLRLRASVQELKRRQKRIRVIHSADSPPGADLPGISITDSGEHQAILHVAEFDDALPSALRDRGAESVEVMDIGLEEIYIETVRGAGVASPPGPGAAADAGADENLARGAVA